ncbi:MAG: FtsH protease activity modulator HflK [Rhodoferax sp.]|nr:FtsH protease activity modulator HflK [Rhodoferax sp.]
MKFSIPNLNLGSLSGRFWGTFNLNDSRWGRSDEGKSDATGQSRPESTPEPKDNPPHEEERPRPNPRPGAQSGPPDLDELWRDFNRKLNGWLGSGKKLGGGQGRGPGGRLPEFKNAGIGGAVIAALVFLVWLGTGFFIVQEGQQAVITQFGSYKSTVNAGFNWRMPYPIQRHELVFVTQIRSVDVGRDNVLKATGLRESAMLTQDENILDIKFAVQYRLNDARAFLFESKNPTDAVVQAAETSVREVLGKMNMDAALSEDRDQIAPKVRAMMQEILDRYKVGIEVVGINLQQGGVRPPEQVQASFDDVLKAGQERERTKNEAQAYANDVIPRAVGSASRLKEEADAYKARVVAQAQGDAQRFRSVYNEYQKAPQVTRDRMYLDTMQQIFANVTKVLVDSRQGATLLNLPLDKILQLGATGEPASAVAPASASPSTPTTTVTPNAEARSRDAVRTRERDAR